MQNVEFKYIQNTPSNSRQSLTTYLFAAQKFTKNDTFDDFECSQRCEIYRWPTGNQIEPVSYINDTFHRNILRTLLEH